MTPEVAQALQELKESFTEASVTARDDGEGGAFVVVEPVDPGQIYRQRQVWVGFRITGQYPYADVYPHFIIPDLARTDGQPLGQGLSPSTFDGRPAIQVSRRSNHLDPTTDTATIKLFKVLDWLATQ
jgi:hypothetical protein